MSDTGMNFQHIDILLVEDNTSDAELTLRALRRRHLANAVLHVLDGDEALEFLRGEGRFAGRETQRAPKVVILDLKLPKIDGLQVLRAMKADEKLKAIPVVMLTSSRQERDILEAYKLGVNSYIVKPVEFDSFAEAVANLGFYWLMLNERPVQQGN